MRRKSSASEIARKLKSHLHPANGCKVAFSISLCISSHRGARTSRRREGHDAEQQRRFINVRLPDLTLCRTGGSGFFVFKRRISYGSARVRMGEPPTLCGRLRLFCRSVTLRASQKPRIRPSLGKSYWGRRTVRIQTKHCGERNSPSFQFPPRGLLQPLPHRFRHRI